MTNTLWIFFCALSGLFLELLFAYNHLGMPIIATVCLYTTVVFRWRKTVLIFIIMGTIVDPVLGRWFPFTPFLVLSAAAVGEFCCFFALTRSQFFAAISSFLLSGCTLIWLGLIEILFPNLFVASSRIHAIWTKGFFTFSPIMLMPACIFVLDKLANRVGASTSQDGG